MRREKRKFLIVAGLFLSGLNPSWALSSQKLTSNIKAIEESEKNLIYKKQGYLYEVSSIDNLSIPTESQEVLVKRFRNINFDELENILINNNRTIKIYLEKVI